MPDRRAKFNSRTPIAWRVQKSSSDVRFESRPCEVTKVGNADFRQRHPAAMPSSGNVRGRLAREPPAQDPGRRSRTTSLSEQSSQRAALSSIEATSTDRSRRWQQGNAESPPGTRTPFGSGDCRQHDPTFGRRGRSPTDHRSSMPDCSASRWVCRSYPVDTAPSGESVTQPRMFAQSPAALRLGWRRCHGTTPSGDGRQAKEPFKTFARTKSEVAFGIRSVPTAFSDWTCGGPGWTGCVNGRNLTSSRRRARPDQPDQPDHGRPKTDRGWLCESVRGAVRTKSSSDPPCRVGVDEDRWAGGTRPMTDEGTESFPTWTPDPFELLE